jgi:Ran GTPase-activating protein (RanGAP) involved in mRNA processing and transport
LQFDQNPLGAEHDHLFGLLVGEDSNLKTLTLRGNAIGDRGANVIAIALKINRSLRTIDLRFNGIGKEGAEQFAEVMLERCVSKSD